VAEILSHFEGVTKASAGWMARCPAHEDRKQSLSVSQGERQPWVLHCHAGCSPGAILAAAGLTMADILSPRENGTRRAAGRISYKIRDTDGQIVAIHERIDSPSGKRFVWRQPDGTPGLGGRHGVDLPLYGIESLRDLAPGSTVVLTEGERARDAVLRAGLPAVATVTGASATPSDVTLRPLVPFRVVVWPDADDQGRGHMTRTAARLTALGCTDVRRVEWLDAPDHGDAADYGGDVRALVAAAPPFAQSESFSRAVIVRVADVQSERVTWLWRRRIARGKLTLLMGDPGVGKSLITIDIASRVTRGLPWPDGGQELPPPSNVLFLAAEDGIGDTIRPRLQRAGADLERAFVFTTVRDDEGDRLPNFERDIGILEAEILRLRPALVIVDPISSYLGKADSYKDAEMRRVLAPLAVLADKHRVAVVALVHMTKGSSDGKALYRAMGSIAFAALARIVLAAGGDPDQPERCYLMPVKQNICKPSDTLAYSLKADPDDEDAAARLEWEAQPVEGIRPEVILGAGGSSSDRDHQQDAADFLKQLLADGRMRAEEVMQASKGHGYSSSTINRAKARAGVRSYKEGFRGAWYWELDAAKSTTPRNVTIFGQEAAVSHVESTTSPKVVNPDGLTTFADDPEVGLV
jgi:putative DNA primase/helicase